MGGQRRRKLLASSGAMFVCAGFALIPVLGHTAFTGETPRAVIAAAAPEPDGRVREVRPHNDPFARALPGAIQRSGVRKMSPKKTRDLRVVAIVMGAAPHALLSLEGTTQIVGVGDVFENTRVRSIQAGRVVLADGRRLTLSERL